MLIYLVDNYSQPTGIALTPLLETPDTGMNLKFPDFWAVLANLPAQSLSYAIHVSASMLIHFQ